MTNPQSEDLVRRLREPLCHGKKLGCPASHAAEAANLIEQLERDVGFLTAFADAPDMETHKTTRDELREELAKANAEADTLAALVDHLLNDCGAWFEPTTSEHKDALTIAQRRVNGE